MKWVLAAVAGALAVGAARNFIRETQEAMRSTRRPKEPWELG